MKKRFLSMLVLLAAVATGAWAQTETLLTTITPTGKDTYSETTAGVVTVSHDNTHFDSSSGWVWATEAGSVTVEAKDGYTITKCVFIKNGNPFATISSSPFKVNFILSDETETYYCEGTDVMDGFNCVTSIEVYGPAPAPTGYKITLDEGTGNKDSQNWEITPKSSELGGGEAVTVKYNGSREVKSVTVVKKAAVNPNAYMKWDADQKKLVATPMPESFTTVTSSTTTWSAGTYVVEGEVNITSTIELSGDVNLIIKDGAKLTANKIIGVGDGDGDGDGDDNNILRIYGQANQTGQLVVHGSNNGDAFMKITTLEVHSAKVTATASYDNSGGFCYIGTFNVYGGSVDAKATGPKGYGIYLKEEGSMNIYGGEVKAEGKGSGIDSYGITSGASISMEAAYVTVYGGKLWAGNANNSALNYDGISFTKDNGYTSGKIEYSSDNSNWSEEEDAYAKYVRVGY